MISKFAFLGNLLLASVALADPPSQPEALLARQSQSNQTATSVSGFNSSNVPQILSEVVSGVGWYGNHGGWVGTVDITFVAPTIEGNSPGWGLDIYAAIDGLTCKDAELRAGVVCTFDPKPNSTVCRAYSKWVPDQPREELDIPISPGDQVRITVFTISRGYGSAVIENKRAPRTAQRNFMSKFPLCQANAMVAAQPMGNLTTMNYTMEFTDISITSLGATTYTLSNGATIVSLVSNTGKLLTFVDILGDTSFVIHHFPTNSLPAITSG